MNGAKQSTEAMAYMVFESCRGRGAFLDGKFDREDGWRVKEVSMLV